MNLGYRKRQQRGVMIPCKRIQKSKVTTGDYPVIMGGAYMGFGVTYYLRRIYTYTTYIYAYIRIYTYTYIYDVIRTYM